MLDPTRFALNAETVGFRKRMGLPVDWGAFNQALQTETDCINVRRELEETPVSELHVMGGERYGLESNVKTNERARQERQMNGYVLRSFLATGGPVILPPKKNDSLLGIPSRFGQVQYTPNAVQGQQYTSRFTEPLNAPLENNTILLGKAGIEARSNSISNPFAALQFQMNMEASQEQIRALERDHAEARNVAFQEDFRRQSEIQSAPKRLQGIMSAMDQIRAIRQSLPSPPERAEAVRGGGELQAAAEAEGRIVVRQVDQIERFITFQNGEVLSQQEAQRLSEMVDKPFENTRDEASADTLANRYDIPINQARLFMIANDFDPVQAGMYIAEVMARERYQGASNPLMLAREQAQDTLIIDRLAGNQNANSAIGFNTIVNRAVLNNNGSSFEELPQTATGLAFYNGGNNSTPAKSTLAQRAMVKNGLSESPMRVVSPDVIVKRNVKLTMEEGEGSNRSNEEMGWAVRQAKQQRLQKEDSPTKGAAFRPKGAKVSQIPKFTDKPKFMTMADISKEPQTLAEALAADPAFLKRYQQQNLESRRKMEAYREKKGYSKI